MSIEHSAPAAGAPGFAGPITVLPRLGQGLRALWGLRPELSARSLMLLVALYLALTQNFSLAAAVAKTLPQPFGFQEWRIAASVFVTLMAIILLAMIPWSAPRTIKPAAVVFLLVAAVCSYFMDTFGAIIDDSMIVNALRTDYNEAGDLMHGAFWMHVLLLGGLPSLLVLRLRVSPERSLPALGRRTLWFVLVLLAELAVLGLQYNTLAFWGRTNRDVRLLVNPTYPMYSAIHHLRSEMPGRAPPPLAVIAPDAVRAEYPGARPFLMVMVVGETARAQNFSLNGYARETNPRLAAIPDVVNFGYMSSCGTATAESVPCIFSGLGKADFSKAKAAQQQNILDVLDRLKVNVAWWDNDSGCQGVCQRVAMRDLEKIDDPALCKDGECRDGILLRDLHQVLTTAAGSNLLVLHMKGSHGPAYFKRYPESARRFTPDCADENVQRCSHEEVVNAYDNTLVYTDSVLADLIGQLRDAQGKVDSAVVYVSDHGESLGENGVYLHGLPYALAPREQTTVPMIAWFSQGVRESLGLDMACVAKVAQQPATHDRLFHSLLGMFQVKTTMYQPEQDLFTRCRS